MKKTATGNVGAEELARVERTVVNRKVNRMQADALFGNSAADARQRDSSEIRRLFEQAEAAQTGTTPALAVQEKTASIAPNVDAFLEKVAEAQLSEAQRRYPELQKVAVSSPLKVPNFATKKPAGKIPVRSSLSGGSA